MAKLVKLTRETLAEQAVQSLMLFIEAEEMKPGELLPPETELAANLGVSRPTVREALRSLEGKGIIDVVGGKGAMIKPPDAQPLRLFFQRTMQLNSEAIVDMVELRKGIEMQSGALAARRRTDVEVKQLGEITAEMRQNMGNPSLYVELDSAFHLLIASMSGNSMIYHLVHSIREALKDILHESLVRPHSPSLLERVQVGHEMILATLQEGNVQAATLAMATHFDEAITSILEGSGKSVTRTDK